MFSTWKASTYHGAIIYKKCHRYVVGLSFKKYAQRRLILLFLALVNLDRVKSDSEYLCKQ